VTALGWKSDEFTPVSSALRVWNGSGRTKSYDNSKRSDLAVVLDQLDQPVSRVHEGDLTGSTDDLSAKFGMRR